MFNWTQLNCGVKEATTFLIVSVLCLLIGFDEDTFDFVMVEDKSECLNR